MADDYQFSYVARRPPTKKKTKTPEAKVSTAVDKYLKRLGVINIRTNAGSWADDDGRIIMGAKAGTADKHVCLPNGVFTAIETKSAIGKQSEAQQKYQARVEALGGIYILARSSADVRAALVARFGEATVALWESPAAPSHAARGGG
jgi:hypothetical protein